MELKKPVDLSLEQWSLLQFLGGTKAPFYLEDTYEAYKNGRTDRMEYYQTFFRLASLNYIMVYETGVVVPNEKVKPSYLLTPKGTQSVTDFTQSW